MNYNVGRCLKILHGMSGRVEQKYRKLIADDFSEESRRIYDNELSQLRAFVKFLNGLDGSFNVGNQSRNIFYSGFASY